MSALAPVIPDDILYIAQHVCGYVEAMPSEGNVNVIASAIMAERDRCAKIARDTAKDLEPSFMADAAWLIVGLIRNPHLPSGAAACAADTSVATLLPSTEGQFKSDGPKSRPGDAAASLTQQSNSPRQERPSAQERSSDRSGGQFGDAPKPAHIPGTEVQP